MHFKTFIENNSVELKVVGTLRLPIDVQFCFLLNYLLQGLYLHILFILRLQNSEVFW